MKNRVDKLTKKQIKTLGENVDQFFRVPQFRKIIRAQLAAQAYSGTDDLKDINSRVLDALAVADKIYNRA